MKTRPALIAALSLLSLCLVYPQVLSAETDQLRLLIPLPRSHFIEQTDRAIIDWTSHIVYAVGSSEARSWDETTTLVRSYEVARQAIFDVLERFQVAHGMAAGDYLGTFAGGLLELQGMAADPLILAEFESYENRPVTSVLLGLDLRKCRVLPLLVEGGGLGESQTDLARPTPIPPKSSAEWLSEIRHPTGLIIDARNLDLKPALCPSIYAEDGRLVFDLEYARRAWFFQRGGICYMSDIDAANSEEFIGVNPKIVKAILVHRQNESDLVVSDDDADRLIFLRQRLTFFAECRVIVVGTPQGPHRSD
ncbi:MAG: hypothetical protein JW941_12690 [Candidatus Coatesbacteria bacterium]|nr:hypothetical protein [Candidatus Coatesbacteria bacterium]